MFKYLSHLAPYCYAMHRKQSLERKANICRQVSTPDFWPGLSSKSQKIRTSRKK